jgi:hypothetical protein
VYLGPVVLDWHARGAVTFDLYVCPQRGLPTVVLRWGPAVDEYDSGVHLTDLLPEPQATSVRTQLLAQVDTTRLLPDETEGRRG